MNYTSFGKIRCTLIKISFGFAPASNLLHIISQTRKKHSTSAPKDPNVVSHQQEEDDIAKAIQLSLQESKSSPSQQVTLKSEINWQRPEIVNL